MIPKIDLFVDAYQEALETLNAAAEYHPGYADIQHRLGLLYYLSGAPERAIEFHLAALRINADYVAAHSALGYAREAAGDPDGAVAVWETALGRTGEGRHPGTALDLAMAAGRRGAPEEGLALIARIPESLRSHDLVGRERALLELLAGHLDEGARQLMALRVRSPYYRSFFARAGLTRNGRLVEERVDSFVAEREANHNLADILAYLSDTYAAFQSYTKAEAELVSALEAGFDLPSFHVRLGRLRRLAGDVAAAAREFERAIELDASHVGARIELGHELAALDESTAALEQFEIVARLRPGYADIHYQIGLLLLEHGELERSRAALAAALAINPRFALARASLALAYLRDGRDSEAHEQFERALADGLVSPDIYLNLARIAMRSGDTDRALSYLHRGTQIGPTYAPLYYHLGRIHRQQGNKLEAQEAWRQFFSCADDLEFADRLELFREDLSSQLAFAQG